MLPPHTHTHACEAASDGGRGTAPCVSEHSLCRWASPPPRSAAGVHAASIRAGDWSAGRVDTVASLFPEVTGVPLVFRLTIQFSERQLLAGGPWLALGTASPLTRAALSRGRVCGRLAALHSSGQEMQPSLPPLRGGGSQTPRPPKACGHRRGSPTEPTPRTRSCTQQLFTEPVCAGEGQWNPRP